MSASQTEPRTDAVGALQHDDLTEVTALADAAHAEDGVHPLSEHFLLHLDHQGETPASHLLLRTKDGTLAGYAQLDQADRIAATAELVVHPRHRRRGHGRALLRQVIDFAPGRELRVWAHGSLPAAQSLAKSLGLEQVRELWQMRRRLTEPVAEPTPPAGVTIRTFRVGEDEEHWLQLNRRAFENHPEQGRWTIDDLKLRMSEPWFDPAGFFLAEEDGCLLGFHWTKVHAADGVPVGEVYVVGVDPQAQGRGLGKFLTLVGLRHLQQMPLREVLLYVEAANAAAVEVYRKLGFTHRTTDVMFRR